MDVTALSDCCILAFQHPFKSERVRSLTDCAVYSTLFMCPLTLSTPFHTCSIVSTHLHLRHYALQKCPHSHPAGASENEHSNRNGAGSPQGQRRWWPKKKVHVQVLGDLA